MLNLNGVFKMISIKASGVAKNGRKYVNVLAVDFFNQPSKEEREAGVKCRFFMLKAFGEQADFILRNFKDKDGSRRAFISGDIKLEDYVTSQSVTKTIKFDGKKGKVAFDVDVTKISVAVYVKDISFLDKANAHVKNETEFTPEDDNDDEVTFEVENDGNNKPEGEHTSILKDEECLPPED